MSIVKQFRDLLAGSQPESKFAFCKVEKDGKVFTVTPGGHTHEFGEGASFEVNESAVDANLTGFTLVEGSDASEERMKVLAYYVPRLMMMPNQVAESTALIYAISDGEDTLEAYSEFAAKAAEILSERIPQELEGFLGGDIECNCPDCAAEKAEAEAPTSH